MIRKHISVLTATGAVLAALAGPLPAAEAAKPSPPAAGTVGTVTVPVDAELLLQTEEQKTLYALGLALAQNLGRLSLQEAELSYLLEGLQDGVLQHAPRVDVHVYGPKVQELAQQRMAAAGEREQATAEEFLTRMAGESGAARTDSGIVIVSRQEGTGPSPAKSDTVRVNYEGKLPDGTVFDSSLQRGAPASFQLDQVIPCWTEVVQRMRVGGKLKVVCPPELAYGSDGRPGIPPNSPLIFDIHLLGIGDAATAAPGQGKGDDDRDPLEQQIAALYG